MASKPALVFIDEYANNTDLKRFERTLNLLIYVFRQPCGTVHGTNHLEINSFLIMVNVYP